MVHEHVRRDIAAQLHDGLREKILILKGRLQELLKGTSSASETDRVLSEVIDSLNQEIERQVGILSRRLYPSTLNLGLASAFQSFRDQFAAALAVEIELDEELMRQEKADRNLLPEQVGLAVYRIAEEALTNVVKHAKAGKVAVRLDQPRVGWLRLTVRDDGQGFDVEKLLMDWGWQQCKTTLRPWMESVWSTAIRAWARRLRPCSLSRDLARSIWRPWRKETTDGEADQRPALGAKKKYGWKRDGNASTRAPSVRIPSPLPPVPSRRMASRRPSHLRQELLHPRTSWRRPLSRTW